MEHTIGYCEKCGEGHSLLDGLCYGCRCVNFTQTEMVKIQEIALSRAERNLAAGIWTSETAELFLTIIAEQPEAHGYLINKCLTIEV